MKKRVRLTESELNRIVKESVNKMLNRENEELSDRDKRRQTDGEWEDYAIAAKKAFANCDFRGAIEMCKKASEGYNLVVNGEEGTFGKIYGGFGIPNPKANKVIPWTNGSSKRMDAFLLDPKTGWYTEKTEED